MGNSNTTFNKKTTGEQVLQHAAANSENPSKYLSNAHVFITGGSDGIGKETARVAFAYGASITLACRNKEKTQKAMLDIANQDQQAMGERLQFVTLDLSDLSSVESCVSQFSSENKFGPITHLFNNAGLMSVKKQKTKQGFEMTFGVNVLGHHALTMRLLDNDLLDRNARIVFVSSLMHKFGKMDFEDLHYEKRSYSHNGAYCQSKLANILQVRELNKKLKQDERFSNMHVYSVHPGWIQTSFAKDLTGMEALFQKYFTPFQKSLQAGAATSLYCGFHPEAADDSGLYYSDAHCETPTKAAQSDEDAKKLWDVCVESTGLDFPAPTDKATE